MQDEFENTWAVVLAAGEGTRLRTLTTTRSGTAIPKQFCSLQGGPSLLHEALCRARALISDRHTCAVVAEQHRRWWEPELWSLPAANSIVQPCNRGTANGILLPLLQIMECDPGARVVLLPSDHHVREEAILSRSIQQAIEQLSWCVDEPILLGLAPEEPDPQLGYIVPQDSGRPGTSKVARFVEKPNAREARELIAAGALWNAFIVVSTAQALLALFERSAPQIVEIMRAAVRTDLGSPGCGRATGELYEQLPTVDFSRDIVPDQKSHIRVQPVPPCGWSDLGTPERVGRALRRTPPRREADRATRVGDSHLSLAAAHERLQRAAATGPESLG